MSEIRCFCVYLALIFSYQFGNSWLNIYEPIKKKSKLKIKTIHKCTLHEENVKNCITQISLCFLLLVVFILRAHLKAKIVERPSSVWMIPLSLRRFLERNILLKVCKKKMRKLKQYLAINKEVCAVYSSFLFKQESKRQFDFLLGGTHVFVTK